MKKIVCVLTLVGLSIVAGCKSASKDRPYTIAFVSKIKGIPYFEACEKGAEEAASELKLGLRTIAPTKADSNEQINLLTAAIASGEYNALAVACTEKDRVSPTLRTAGMPVVTFDADAQPAARQFFVNMATYDAVSEALVAELLAGLGANPKGKVAIVTSSLEAPNQAEWAKRIKVLLAKHPGLEVLPEVTHGEDRDLGVSKCRTLIRAEGDKGLVGMIGLTSIAVPAAAEAVRQAGLKGKVVVTGVSTPRDMRDYVKDGTVKAFVLWNPVDLGYLTVYVCDLLRREKMPTTGTIEAGRLGKIEVKDGEVLLGKPLRFTKETIDNYSF